jgi:hypothetical protein
MSFRYDQRIIVYQNPEITEEFFRKNLLGGLK